MGARLIAVAVACLLASCVHDELVACSDGRLCPVGTACDLVHATCVTPAQTTVCGQLADGDRCDAAGFSGICDGAVCVAGCGDGRQDSGEECDDGNFASHDGCSSSCLREQATWHEVVSPWKARQGHVAAYMTAQQLLVVFGGTSGGQYVGDQWQRDASGTWSEFTGPRPPARSNAVMVYDPTRQRLVLFGGNDPMGNVLADTWEFDGATWTQKTPSVSPPARTGSAMVFMAARGKPLLFGGIGAAQYGDTWEYDAANSTWSMLSLPTAPPSRSGHVMASDPVRNVVVLFGGSSGFLATRGDTWELGQFGWIERIIAGPPGRNGAVMAYSTTRGKIVLFGGVPSGGEASDTWEYDGTTWTQVTTGTQTPPARAQSAAVTDGNGDVVMIGGVQAFQDAFDDVWLYSGGKWSEGTPELTPSPRSTPMSYDATAKSSVIVAGVGNGFLGDVWRFDGAWQRSGTSPEMRFNHALAFDETTQRTVMSGGIGAGFVYASATYFLDSASSTWTSVGATPSARTIPSLGYDANVGGMLEFGGRDANLSFLNDTWELVGNIWTERPQATPPSPGGHPSVVFDARHGYSVLVDASGISWAYKDHAWHPLPIPTTTTVDDDTPLVYDPMRERVVLFARGDAGIVETWEQGETEWNHVDVAGTAPEGRVNPAVTYDRRLRSYVLFGGENATHVFGDTWLLQYHSLTPDESCGNGIDDDGDRQVDAADPDCN